MVNVRKLSHPPIKEALIDFRVTYQHDLTAELLDSIYEDIKGELPKKTIQSSMVVSFSSEDKKLKQEQNGINGYVFKDKQNKKVLQVNKEGITFSLIDNYDEWAVFEEGFWHFVQIIEMRLKIVSVNRVGVRFINKINIPQELDEGLGKYFNVSPSFDVGIKTAPTEMFMRAVLPEKNGYTCILTQGINPMDVTTETVGVILDIDLFRAGTFKLTSKTQLKEVLSDMHDLKNKVFFSIITKSTEELLNEQR